MSEPTIIGKMRSLLGPEHDAYPCPCKVCDCIRDLEALAEKVRGARRGLEYAVAKDDPRLIPLDEALRELEGPTEKGG